jgi:tRNA(Ile)-lysidine synthase
MGEQELIQPDELSALFDPIVPRPAPPCALAVSGGGDSTALMFLFADWLRSRGEDVAAHTIVTVDHGLRQESAGEARAVAAQASALGFQHAILVWQGCKPDSGIQAAARAARYRLIGEYMRANHIACLLTGHTQDDQAETVLMRLARGSGLDGLTGIAPRLQWDDLGLPDPAGEGLSVTRPLLDVPRSRLRATLKARGIPWVEDPSNISPDFERPRLRAARDQLDAFGLTAEKLALSASRLRRVRNAVEQVVDQFCDPAAGAVAVDPLGFVTMDRVRLRALEAEIALRALGRATTACGGSPEPVPLAKLEGVAAVLQSAREGRWTLARAMITATGSMVTIEREPGRQAPAAIQVHAGERALWDGRFRIEVGNAGPAGAAEVRACGEHLARELLDRHPPPARVPLRVAALLPSFWFAGKLVAVPSLEFWDAPHCRDWLKAWFIGSEIVTGRCRGPQAA